MLKIRPGRKNYRGYVPQAFEALERLEKMHQTLGAHDVDVDFSSFHELDPSTKDLNRDVKLLHQLYKQAKNYETKYKNESTSNRRAAMMVIEAKAVTQEILSFRNDLMERFSVDKHGNIHAGDEEEEKE